MTSVTSIVSVSTLLDNSTIHVSPLGSEFARGTFPLFSSHFQPFGNPAGDRQRRFQ